MKLKLKLGKWWMTNNEQWTNMVCGECAMRMAAGFEVLKLSATLKNETLVPNYYAFADLVFVFDYENCHRLLRDAGEGGIFRRHIG